ncbi:Uncharacterised protein [Serratia odorifera]|uniref:Uncharacterized protein n=1 Tax=Serratia odorifera TaxID=618 RepID=A0A3S4DQP7_SEROD|nr:Uncharacterised protein [Serratia odorifera]
MVKSLFGRMKKNNLTSLISRCNEGSLSDSQFLAVSYPFLQNFRYYAVLSAAHFILSPSGEARHSNVAVRSLHSLAYIGSKEAKT